MSIRRPKNSNDQPEDDLRRLNDQLAASLQDGLTDQAIRDSLQAKVDRLPGGKGKEWDFSTEPEKLETGQKTVTLRTVIDSSLSEEDAAFAKELTKEFAQFTHGLTMTATSERAGVPEWMLVSLINSLVVQLDQDPAQVVGIAVQIGLWLAHRIGKRIVEEQADTEPDATDPDGPQDGLIDHQESDNDIDMNGEGKDL